MFDSAPLFKADAAPLLLSPHFDDALFSCWSLLASGEDLHTAVIFSGLPREDWADGNWTGRDEADFLLDRISDTQFLYALAGRLPCFLPFPAARYRRSEPPIAHIAAALVFGAPEVSCIYAPAAICDHPDHLLTRSLALALHETGIPLRLYAEMPSAVRSGWPGLIVPGKGPDARSSVVMEWRERLEGVEQIEITAPIITSLGFKMSVEKQQVVKTLSEQLTGEGAIDIDRALNLMLDPGISRYEVCWPVG